MSVFKQFDPDKQPKYRVELHIHLDGAVRLSTIWELAQKKGIDLQCNTLEDLIDKCTIKKPSSLADFLSPFGLVLPVVIGNPSAIERIAYEFCDDISRQGVIYAEVRYSPHLFCFKFNDSYLVDENFTPKHVVECVNNGLKRGEQNFKVKVRSILCCIRKKPEWSHEVLELCKEFKDRGVVGIDIAGDEAAMMAHHEDIAVFQEAAKCGIHRTVHAAEAGPASNVVIAMEQMLAERIGHGYHVVDDEELYEQCLDRKIHFEACPYTSYMTGSVSLEVAKHPIVRFVEDCANFSINRDAPFICQKTLEQECSLLRKWGMTDVHVTQASFNAARSCFLPEVEKDELISYLKAVFGMEEAVTDGVSLELCP